jgi:hypothetical protein
MQKKTSHNTKTMRSTTTMANTITTTTTTDMDSNVDAKDGKNNSRAIQTTTGCRMIASVITWPVEKSKLLYQGGIVGGGSGSSSSLSSSAAAKATSGSGSLGGGARGGAPTANNFLLLRNVVKRFFEIPATQHGVGMISSAIQRGGSAFFMFTCQSQVYNWTEGMSRSHIVDHCFAGFISGAITAPFHTYWELAKVRGGLPSSFTMYRSALLPMILRHAVFDGVFFGVSAACDVNERHTLIENSSNNDNNSTNTNRYVTTTTSSISSPRENEGEDPTTILSHSGVKFGLAAATASFANLLFDVWKTRRMELFPQRVGFMTGVVQTMKVSSFLTNYLIKGTDLTVNWFVVGCLKDHVFTLNVD